MSDDLVEDVLGRLDAEEKLPPGRLRSRPRLALGRGRGMPRRAGPRSTFWQRERGGRAGPRLHRRHRGGGLSRHRSEGEARARTGSRPHPRRRQERLGKVELRRGARAPAHGRQPALELPAREDLARGLAEPARARSGEARSPASHRRRARPLRREPRLEQGARPGRRTPAIIIPTSSPRRAPSSRAGSPGWRSSAPR